MGKGNAAIAGKARTLTDQQFASAVRDAKGVVLLEFWAPWCPCCGALDSAVEDLIGAARAGVAWVKANAEDCRSLRKRLGVRLLPTLVLFTGGRELDRIEGVPAEEDLRTFIERGLRTQPRTPASRADSTGS